MQLSNLFSYTIVLNSQSPRRKQLLESLGFNIRVVKTHTDEVYPQDMYMEDIPVYLAKQKGKSFTEELKDDEVLVCSDTMVFFGNAPLGKPKDKQQAIEMLTSLSGKEHSVISGCYLRHKGKEISFSETTKVRFKTLSMEEIEYYVDKYQPFDKAGSYGIQEWIGMIGVESIEGDFYNVMGLPTLALFENIKEII